jgi:multidrug transporter EmrE-like cation transporter
VNWTKIALLLLFAVILATGQILFKAAAQSIKGPVGADLRTLQQLILNPYLLGLAIYGAATLYWVLLLRTTDLNKAYLVVALALVLVPLVGTFYFQEPFTPRLIIGLVVILIGLLVALS